MKIYDYKDFCKFIKCKHYKKRLGCEKISMLGDSDFVHYFSNHRPKHEQVVDTIITALHEKCPHYTKAQTLKDLIEL